MTICRACLGSLDGPSNTVNIFEDLYKNRNLSALLLDLFNFKVEIDDEITKEICRSCADKIVDIHEFHLMYVESDRKLRTLHETDYKPTLESHEFDGDQVLPHDFLVAVVKREDFSEPFATMDSDDDSQMNPSSSCDKRSVAIIDSHDSKPLDSKIRRRCKRSVSAWECFECHKTYKSLKTIRKHSKQCNQLKSEAKLAKGRFYHKNESNEFVCDVCSKCFATRQSIYAHIQRHIGQKVLCNICGKCFSNRNNLTKHHKTVHLKEKNYQCPTCEKRYDSSYRLRIHQNAHQGIRLFACPLCPQSFITSSALSRHKKTVHKQGELYECNVCFRKFNVAYNMRAHMVTHTGIKPHICQYCKADFHRKHKLVAHLKEVHKLEYTEWPVKESV